MRFRSKVIKKTIPAFFGKDHREMDVILECAHVGTPRNNLKHFLEFQRRLEQHIMWEEAHLFPALVKECGSLVSAPLRRLKAEHEDIRRLMLNIHTALDKSDLKKCQSLCDMLKNHLRAHQMREEQTLYNQCEIHLPSDVSKRLLHLIDPKKES